MLITIETPDFLTADFLRGFAAACLFIITGLIVWEAIAQKLRHRAEMRIKPLAPPPRPAPLPKTTMTVEQAEKFLQDNVAGYALGRQVGKPRAKKPRGK